MIELASVDRQIRNVEDFPEVKNYLINKQNSNKLTLAYNENDLAFK